jgi:hypothetical protein
MNLIAGYKYEIKFLWYRGGENYRVLPTFDVTELTGGTAFSSATKIQDPSSPLSGTFKLSYKGQAVKVW